MGNVKDLPRGVIAHAVFRGDSEMEIEGQAQELATARMQPFTLDERYISEHGRAEIYGMRMLMRSI